MPFAVACVCALALGVVLQLLMPNGFSLGGGDANDAVVAVAEIHASSTVQINEVMTSNSRLLRDAADNAPDWIEVRNASAEPVNLAGWTLARTAEENHMFVFPDRVLAPGNALWFMRTPPMPTQRAAITRPFPSRPRAIR